MSMIDLRLRDELLRMGVVTEAQLDAAIANVTAPKPSRPKPPPSGRRRIGPRARACLHHFEGVRLEAYRCPAGKPTIGYGNTFYADGRPVKMGDRITRAEAEALFDDVVAQFEIGVEQAAPGAPAHQFGAMVSLAYNIGLGAFGRSSVLRHHKAGRHAEAAEAFLMWVNAGGKRSAGLARRRAAERLLYLNELAAFDKAIGYKG